MRFLIIPYLKNPHAIFIRKIFADNLQTTGRQLNNKTRCALEGFYQPVSFANLGCKFSAHSKHRFFPSKFFLSTSHGAHNSKRLHSDHNLVG
jgi:hypothetical protein